MKRRNSADSEILDNLEDASPARQADLLRTAIVFLRERIPPTWTLDVERDFSDQDRRVDAELRLRAPDGSEITALIEAKRLLNTRDVSMAVEQLKRVAADRGDKQIVLVLVARYLAPATRARIADAGVGYIDMTGNAYLATERPAMFLRDRGADRDPWRGPGRPRGTLKGPPAARVVRALIDFAPPYSVPDIAERARTSTGATYRIVDFLEEEQLLERERRGSITRIRWRLLIERWSRDYGFAESNTISMFLEPRGLTALTARLTDGPRIEYALTGSLAAQRVAPYAASRLAMLYVRDIRESAAALELRPTTTGANVALAVGDYDVVFARTELANGLRVAALSQVAVDLISGPGRNPSEATELLDWMERNESTWRR